MSTAIQTKNKPKGALKPHIPDFCPACDAVDHPFKPVRRKVKQEFRGETLEVEAQALCCGNCGFEIAAPGHLEQLRLATLDAYRLRHGLLTSAEIVERRKAMGLSQRAFAHHVRVGVASLQRWEIGLLVQDEGSDLLLRERTKHTQFISAEIINPKSVTVIVTITRGNFAFPSQGTWKGVNRQTRDCAASVTSNRFNNDWTYALAATA